MHRILRLTPLWVVAFGGIVDAAPVVGGELERDILSLVDLIPNSWSNQLAARQDHRGRARAWMVRVERAGGDVEREPEAGQMHQGKHVVRETGRVGAVLFDSDTTGQAIEDFNTRDTRVNLPVLG